MKLSIIEKAKALLEVFVVLFCVIMAFIAMDYFKNETPEEYAIRLNSHIIITSSDNVFYTKEYRYRKDKCIVFKAFTPASRLPFDRNTMKFHGDLVSCDFTVIGIEK